MEAVQGVNASPCESINSYIEEVVVDSSSITIRKETGGKDSMITGRDSPGNSVDSPTLSRTSSDSDDIIDHTAALLGYMEDSDEDDLREISGFSPAVSLDLELEPIGDEDERNATFEKIFSGDELDEKPTQRADLVMPVQLNFASTSGQKSYILQDEVQDCGAQLKKNRATKHDGKSRKSLADDVPFFYFDSRFVAQAVEEYGQRKRTDIDNKRKQAALKAKALKEKASSAISHKAKKAISVPHALWDKKVRKSHDDMDGPEDGDHADHAKRASKAAMMKLKAQAAFNEKAKKAKEKMSLPKSIKEKKNKSFREHDERSMDAMCSKVYSSIKLPTIPTPPPVGEYMAKTSIAFIGDMNKLVKQASGSIPAISACPSNVSSNNSAVIDEQGFIISPTSSIDLLSPTASFDGIDAACSISSPRSTAGSTSARIHLPTSSIASPGSIASPKANRGELPPLGKKKESSKMTLKLHKTKQRSHRRTTTASF